MKYSYYQNKKQPPCAEVTDEEVANLIRHDEKLINFDEFEGMTGHELSLLKDLITRKFISIRLPYARHTLNLPHWASFAGTCNYPQVLYDPTGNRRFLCYEIKR